MRLKAKKRTPAQIRATKRLVALNKAKAKLRKQVESKENKRTKLRKNPINKFSKKQLNKLRKSIKLYSGFVGKNPTHIKTVTIEVPDIGLLVGKVTALEYEVTEGTRAGNVYRHEFTGVSRPQMYTSENGKFIGFLPGQYIFTTRGFIDRKN